MTNKRHLEQYNGNFPWIALGIAVVDRAVDDLAGKPSATEGPNIPTDK